MQHRPGVLGGGLQLGGLLGRRGHGEAVREIREMIPMWLVQSD
jgi:hypothetical protein